MPTSYVLLAASLSQAIGGFAIGRLFAPVVDGAARTAPIAADTTPAASRPSTPSPFALVPDAPAPGAGHSAGRDAEAAMDGSGARQRATDLERIAAKSDRDIEAAVLYGAGCAPPPSFIDRRDLVPSLARCSI